MERRANEMNRSDNREVVLTVTGRFQGELEGDRSAAGELLR